MQALRGRFPAARRRHPPPPAAGPGAGPFQRQRADGHSGGRPVGRLAAPGAAEGRRARPRTARGGIRATTARRRRPRRRTSSAVDAARLRTSRPSPTIARYEKTKPGCRRSCATGKENFETHGDARQLVPGRSWAAWARALGHLLPPLDVADIGCGEGYLTLERRAGHARCHRHRSVGRGAGAGEGTGGNRRHVTQRRVAERRSRAAAAARRLGSTSRCSPRRCTMRSDPEAAIAEAVSVLRPGGRVLLTRSEGARSELGAQPGLATGTSGSRTTHSSDVSRGRWSRATSAFDRCIPPRRPIHGPRRQRHQAGPIQRGYLSPRASARFAPTPCLHCSALSTARSAGRILMLDGAMGTMVQRHKLDEADVRGTALPRSSHAAQGQCRPARPDTPRSDRRHPSRLSRRPAPTSSRPTPFSSTSIAQSTSASSRSSTS